MTETVGDRVRRIREERGEKQPEFAKVLTVAAKRLKITTVYDNTTVSKMEVGRRDVDLNDVVVIASLDKQKRGREWLAWGDGAPRLLSGDALEQLRLLVARMRHARVQGSESQMAELAPQIYAATDALLGKGTPDTALRRYIADILMGGDENDAIANAQDDGDSEIKGL